MDSKYSNNFVTLFDEKFVTQGLCLYKSLIRTMNSFTLWVICLDETTFSILEKMKLDKIHLIKLSDVENNELKKIKEERTKAEYCWTLTPFVPKFVFDADNSVGNVTYLDADMWFIKSPSAILEQFYKSKADVLITRHDYSKRYDQERLAGKYCVQFLGYKKEGGEELRERLERQCLEWCFARFEDGKFGDQKYIEDWPKIMPYKVFEVEKKGLFVGPWNAKNCNLYDCVAYHFHGLRILDLKRVFTGGYDVGRNVYNKIYKPYLKEIELTIKELALLGFKQKAQLQLNRIDILKIYIKRSRLSIFSYLVPIIARIG
jgi:hypothetical protein